MGESKSEKIHLWLSDSSYAVKSASRTFVPLFFDYLTLTGPNNFFLLRRCKLTTTGPWIQVTPQVRLRDVSIQIDLLDGLIAVWAVGTKGDVLYRHGVTGDCPQVNKNLYYSRYETYALFSCSSQRIWMELLLMYTDGGDLLWSISFLTSLLSLQILIANCLFFPSAWA